MTPTTFATICSKTFNRVEITVSKTKSLPVTCHGKQTRLGGVCPDCGELHISLHTEENSNPYAAVLPTAAEQRMMVAPDQHDPQREGAL